MIINAVKGILIGLALVIPGLSASTFAVVTGLYDKLIFAINNLRKEFKKSMIFLLPIGFGTALGILASTGAVLYLMDNFGLQSYAFFIGLVLGSVPAIWRKMKGGASETGPAFYINYALTIAGFAAIVILGFIVPSDNIIAIHSIQNIGNFFSIFIAGFVACLLLVVPGVSGALVLILMGQFGTVYGAVSNFADVLFMIIRGQDGAGDLIFSSGAIVLTFLGGAVLGLFAAARIVGYFIERYESKVYFAVIGLVLGAVVTLFNFGAAEYFTELSPAVLLNGAMLIVFAGLGYICTKFIAK